MQDVPPERLLTRFPTRLDTDRQADATPEDKYYNLNEYDLIVAFDPDWSELSEEQVKNLQTLGGQPRRRADLRRRAASTRTSSPAPRPTAG